MTTCLIFAWIGWICVFCQPEEDLITDLDGLTWQINYKQYSGYLSLDNGHEYFYWFSESQNKPKTDPVVLWMNGGPGCSSIGDGLFYENGPIHVNDDASLYNNTYSWNINANMLYFDTPICSGFSFNSNNNSCLMNVDLNANDNYYALLKFFDKFPMYIQNSFYITGESFAGVLIPTLTLRILNGNINETNTNSQINIKAFAIGNGRLNIEYNVNSMIWYGYFHGVIDEKTWNNLMTYCCTPPYTRQTCNFVLSTNIKCREYVEKTSQVMNIGRVNPYNLYGDCYHNDGESQFRLQYKDRDIITCSNTKGADTYFNKMNVRKQIHVTQNKSFTWWLCVNTPDYTIQLKYDDMSHVIHNIFQTDHKIYALFYWGDTDMNQNFLGGQWFVNDLGYNVTDERREWYYEFQNNQQVGGWTQEFQRFSFVTVRAAGHMVPQLRPIQSLKIFQHFLQHKPL